MVETPPNVDAILACRSDLHRSVEFLSFVPRPASLPSLYSPEYFQWKTASNPFGHSECYLRVRGGEPASHSSITAKPVNAGLRVASLGELGDTHTHPSHQRQGHFSALIHTTIGEFQAASAGPALVYGLPNDQSLGPYLRNCGCEVAEDLEIAEFRRQPGPNGPTVRSLLAMLRPSAARRSLTVLAPGAQTEEAIDAIWADAAPRLVPLVAKTARWWRWRYLEAPDPYQTLGLRDGAGTLQAYAVVKRSRSSLPLVGHFKVCDLVGRSTEVEEDLFRRVLAAAAPWDVITVWLQSFSPLLRVAKSMGLSRTVRRPLMFFKNDAYRHLRASGVRPSLALGDSDHV